MRQLTFIILLLFVINYSGLAQNTTAVDVQHYKFALTLSDHTDVIEGTATVTLKFLETTSTITLDLGSVDSTGKGMKVSEVKDGVQTLAFTQQHDKLVITTGQKKKGDSAVLVIQYKGIPADALVIAKNLFGKRTFFGDNWPNRAHFWLPCNDIPADKATLEFLVTAPAHYSIVSNGIKIGETLLNDSTKRTHWREDVPLPTKVMVIGAADFAISEPVYAGTVPVTSWIYQEDMEAGFHDYTKARDILQFFDQYIGPYGYKKLANVQSKTIFGGMENAGAIFYFERSVTGKGGVDDLLAHEIAHQWFGDMVTENNFKHVWLSEGFATYFTDLYVASVSGADSMHRRMHNERSRVIEFVKNTTAPVIDTTCDYFKLLSPSSYQKGAWILHMLRMKTGDAMFQKIIRAYYKKFAGANASSEDFITVAETVSRQKLQSFFKQWLYQPGLPVVDIKWDYHPSSKKLIVNIGQQQAALFSFPLEIEVQSGNKKIRKTIHVINRKTLVAFDMPEKVTALIPDPGYKLLWEQAASL